MRKNHIEPDRGVAVPNEKSGPESPLSPCRLIRLDQKDIARPKDQVLPEPRVAVV
jgi:hypothetical protein